MGRVDLSEVFVAFNGEISNEDELLQSGISTGKHTLTQYIYLFRLIRSYWFQDYDEAARLTDLYGSHLMRFLDIYHTFYGGLTALRLAQGRDNDKEKWIGIGKQAVETFRAWNAHSKWNFENKWLLLTAELKAAKGENGLAEELYKAAILSAHTHRFIHEEGLGMELLGNLYKKTGNIDKSKDMIRHARVCYEKWGAAAIVSRLDSVI